MLVIAFSVIDMLHTLDMSLKGRKKMSKNDLIHQKSNSWKMFDEISPTYDRVNRMMTGCLDTLWRKKVGLFLPCREQLELLDCATGTADQLLTLLKHHKHISSAIGIDLSKNMLKIAREKIEKSPYKLRASLLHASALDLPFKSESFDCITMSFGIRNVDSISTCLSEMHRVLRPEGRLLILETSIPTNTIAKRLHLHYLRKVMPPLAALLSKKITPYRYLNETIESFPYGKTFCNLLEIHKFQNVKAHPMLFGTVCIYQADRAS